MYFHAYIPELDLVIDTTTLSMKYLNIESHILRNQIFKKEIFYDYIANNNFWIIRTSEDTLDANKCKKIISNIDVQSNYQYLKNMKTDEVFYNDSIKYFIELYKNISKSTLGFYQKLI